jgi:nucleoside-triphosphatase
MIEAKNLFITGKPASGKTMLVREVTLEHISEVGGFFTEEMIENGVRSGFLLKTFEGKSGILAKKGLKTGYKLNKYGIDLGVLEGIGVEALRKAMAEKKLIVIDEIGSMEVMSEAFRQALLECLNSPKRVLATIRHNAQPFTDEVKKMDNTSILYLSRQNYLETKKTVKDWLNFLSE